MRGKGRFMNVISMDQYRERRNRAREKALYRAIEQEQRHFNAVWDNLQKLPPNRVVQIFQKSLKYGLLNLQDMHKRFD